MKVMKTVNSVSGGKTSAFMAANYAADYNVFSLIRIEDQACAPKDPILKREAEARTGQPFIATAEEDNTMYAVLDLEQYIGRAITWVTGPTFDHTINHGGGIGRSDRSGGILPTWARRYCTQAMKLEPIFYWWKATINEIVEMRIGYRANETKRAVSMLAGNPIGSVQTFRATFEKRKDGKNKWMNIPWRIPAFPMIESGILRWEIENYWEGKPVRFPRLNNCVGCFHRVPALLKLQWAAHPEKMQWFSNQEIRNGNTFRTGITYEQIKNQNGQEDLFAELFMDDLEACSSGMCEP